MAHQKYPLRGHSTLTFGQLGRIIDMIHMDFTLQQAICGRNRKNIKLIESATGTAIYFPPPYSRYFRYCPKNASPRDPNEIIITGDKPRQIELAKLKLGDLLNRCRLYVKDVPMPPEKVDTILLTRLDKVRKIVEANGSYIQFPPLGSRSTPVRIQATENLHIERTVRELMSLVSILALGYTVYIIANIIPGWSVLQRVLGSPA